jgi:2-polyprenyl-3-methyl-5-hydroxy-6-metoxy-1,4-benzoquinol methylase
MPEDRYGFKGRMFGYKIIADKIESGSKVFDYACGLGVLDKLLENNGCEVSGCDFSTVAIDYCNEHLKGDYRVGDKIFGGSYDYIIASQILEHFKNPTMFIRNCLKKSRGVICAIPNNFNRTGEHIDMAWKDWVSFNELFKRFKVTRLDTHKYPKGLSAGFKHPIFLFEEL